MRIAFIKVGLNSFLNQAVEKILRREFPEARVVTCDITHDLFGSRLKAAASNVFWSMRQYGLQALRSRNSLLNNFYTTGYFEAVRRMVNSKINPADYLFSIQTQSLFDASVPGLPHFVYTDHTHLANLDYPAFNPQDLAPADWIEHERTIYHNAAMVLTMSSNITRSLTGTYRIPQQKVSCIYAGCSLENQTQHHSSAQAKNILFTGKDWQRKGGSELFQAFADIRSKHPDATLTMAGCSPPPPHPPGVKALGRISRQALISAYQQASIFCLPTRMEPFGLAILEAMTFGLPVIATGIGAIPDMVEQEVNGLLVPNQDPTALAGAIDRLLSDPGLCRQMGAAGRRMIAERYNWSHTGKLMKQAIRSVMPLTLSEQTGIKNDLG